jgi:hypothetical protein
VLREPSRFKEAHEYLNHARRLTVSIKNKVKTAQVDECLRKALTILFC